MTPYPIREFSRAVCGYNSRNPLLAMMIAAYFDESGIHDQSKVVSVGGVMGPMREWNRLERPWNNELKKVADLYPEVSWFHATECASQREQFAGVPALICESLANGLSLALGQRKLVYTGGAVFREHWDKCTTSRMRSIYKNPYGFCAVLAIQRACEIARQRAPGEVVTFVFAVPKDADKAQLEAIHEAHRSGSKTYSNVGSLGFASPRQLIQLQAADLVAYEAYRYLNQRWQEGPAVPFEPRPAITRMYQVPGDRLQIGYFDCEGLKGIANDEPRFRDPIYVSGAGSGGAMPA